MTGGLAAIAGDEARRPQSIAAETQAEPTGQRPNLLFIMTDQQRFDCLGANGNPFIQTPNLDRLAKRSANLQNAFVQSPVCVPSRGCYFTGLYAHSHRNRVNYTPMERSEVFLQRMLRDAGYETACVGKLHLYPPTNAEARRSGFNRVLLHDGAGRADPYSDYAKWRGERDPNKDVHYRAYSPDVAPGKNPFRAVIADEFTDTTWTGLKTRETLTELAAQTKPFFLFTSFWKPHSPYEVSVPFDSMYDDVEIPLPRPWTLDEIRNKPLPVQKQILRFKPQYAIDRKRLQWIYRSYYASVSHIDREVGSILTALEQAGLAENTVIVFASDHGDQLLEHGLLEKNVLYEGSIHVPMLVCFPGHVKPGRYDDLVESVDLLPSLFELLGLAEPKHAQGAGFASLIADRGGAYEPKTAVFSENVIPEVLTRPSNMTYRFEKGQGIAGIRHPDAKMVRTRRWKYCHYPEGYAELFDLQNDPNEEQNLSADAKHRATLDELKERIMHWLITADETRQIAERWLL